MGMPVFSDKDKLNNRVLYSFYDRVYSTRDSSNTCVPILACYGKHDCPPPESTMKDGRNPSNMICGSNIQTQNMQKNAFPTHTASSASADRKLLDYSQLSLIHQSEPMKRSTHDALSNTLIVNQ
jgi:hypothetical protein